MQATSLHEVLARDRQRYERLLLARMGTAISKEDAEDIVSEALIRVQVKAEDDPPRPGRGEAWFARIVLNLGIDFLRARDGRRRNGASPRPTLVPLSALEQEPAGPADDIDEGLDALKGLGDEVTRQQERDLVRRVMAALDPKDAELIKLRHLMGGEASREQMASMAGLTLGEYRWRYARAWNRFVDAVALDAPTERCHRVRRLLGALDAGTAPADAAAEIDAHTLDCASCRVFARESYRALELIPTVPVVGFVERWTTRIGSLWDRSGPEATAGAGSAAAGAGIWSLLSGGGLAGVIKLTAIVCSATAVTAGICAGVVAVIDDLDDRGRAPKAHAKHLKKERATPTPAAPRPESVTTPTPTPRHQKKATPRKPRRESQMVDTSGESEIPASAPEGASEFSPGATNASLDPAPATHAGGGEFSP